MSSLHGTMTFQECRDAGIHLQDCDNDGYCNYCGCQEPEDYEPCGDCGYDHDYEYGQATRWHKSNPCSYCTYDHQKREHQSTCPTMAKANVVKLEVHHCKDCGRNVLARYDYCSICRMKQR